MSFSRAYAYIPIYHHASFKRYLGEPHWTGFYLGELVTAVLGMIWAARVDKPLPCIVRACICTAGMSPSWRQTHQWNHMTATPCGAAWMSSELLLPMQARA